MKTGLLLFSLLLLFQGSPTYRFFILTKDPMCSDCVTQIGQLLNKKGYEPILVYPKSNIGLVNIEEKNRLTKSYEKKINFTIEGKLLNIFTIDSLNFPRLMRVENETDTLFLSYEDMFLRPGKSKNALSSVLFQN